MGNNTVLGWVGAAFAGFAVMFVTNAAAAAVVVTPLYEDDYPELAADGSMNFPVLIGGYLIIAAGIALLVGLVPPEVDWRRAGLSVGAAVGAVSFLGVHTVQAGYTSMNRTAWILSGLFDVVGPAAAALIVAYIRNRTTRAHAGLAE